MARFRCRACGAEGTCEYTGVHACPNCGAQDVQFAIATDELPDDHPLVVWMRSLAEETDPED